MPGAAEPVLAKPRVPGSLPAGPFQCTSRWRGLCTSPHQAGGRRYPRGFAPSPATAQLISAAPGSTPAAVGPGPPSASVFPAPQQHPGLSITWQQVQSIWRYSSHITFFPCAGQHPMLQIPNSASSPVSDVHWCFRGASPSSHPYQFTGEVTLSKLGSIKNSSPRSSLHTLVHNVLWPV